MTTTKITIEFDADKFKALEKFASKKNVDINVELLNTLEKMYQKVVPVQVREFIEEK